MYVWDFVIGQNVVHEKTFLSNSVNCKWWVPGGLLWKGMGDARHTFQGLRPSTSYGVQHVKVHSGSFCSTFCGIEMRKYDRRWCLILDLVPLRIETAPTRLVLTLPPASLSIKMWQQKSTEGYEQLIIQHGRIKVSFCHFIDKRWEMARMLLYEKWSSTSPW